MGKIDLTGQRFGRLVVICENGRAKDRHVLWLCKCDCGSEVTVRGRDLKSGHTTSCGCLQRERSSECNTTHGMYNTHLYRVWASMLTRVGVYKGADEEAKRDYIDRGITVCDEWKTFENFRDWAFSNNYSKGLQIDRIDNDRGYEPSNCRWVTCRENVRNRRCTVRLSDGTAFAEFCQHVGIEIRNQTTHKPTKQYDKYANWFMRHNGEGHPELLKKANETVCIMRKCLEMRELLNEVRALRASP